MTDALSKFLKKPKADATAGGEAEAVLFTVLAI